MAPKTANPFTPGAGKPPPFLAGRAREQATLGEMAERLLQPRGRMGDPVAVRGDILIMFGPRGTGKTSLLEWFAREHGKRVGIESVMPDEQGNLSMDVFKELLSGINLAESSDYSASEDASARAKFGIGGFGAEFGGGGRSGRVDHVKRDRGALRAMIEKAIIAANQPLALVVDEGHTLNQSSRVWLFHLAHNVIKRGAPFLLVMGGTPGLNLDFTGVSYVGRCDRMAVGLLDVEGAADAVRVPLEKRGILIDEDALRQVVRDSLCYPYFLQLWGRALWERARARAEAGPRQKPAGAGPRLTPADAGPRLTPADVEAVRPEVDAHRRRFYIDRYQEQFEDDDALRIAAVAVAEAYRDSPATGYSRAQLKRIAGAALAEWNSRLQQPQVPFDAAKEATAQVQALVRWDFVWQTPSSRYLRPGIPSFMAYTLRCHREDHPPPPP